MKLIHAKLCSQYLVNNITSKIKTLKTDVENNLPSSIGCNSSTNTRAPVNCYNYQASYIPDPNSAYSKLYVTGDTSSFYEKAGVNVSYSGPSIKSALVIGNILDSNINPVLSNMF